MGDNRSLRQKIAPGDSPMKERNERELALSFRGDIGPSIREYRPTQMGMENLIKRRSFADAGTVCARSDLD